MLKKEIKAKSEN